MIKDLRFAFRQMLKQPGFAFVAVLVLALGIGANTAIFSVVNAVLLRPLPYRDAGRLAMIWSSSENNRRASVSFDDFEDWRRDSKTLESAALFSSYYKPILSGAGNAERLSALLVSHQYFGVMGAQPKLGRFFLPA